MSKSKTISSTKKNELTLNDTERNTLLATIYDGGIPHIVIKDTLKISLMTFYRYLDKNPKFKDEFEKLLAIFSSDVTELTNQELLFLREKQNYVKWLAPRLSSLFVERTKQEVKQDTTLTVQWEDNHSDMIDVAAEDVVSSNDI
jgi:hypothetical protein